MSGFGPDVSSWQHSGGTSIDMPAVATNNGSPNSFIAIKVTQGVNYINPYWEQDRTNAHAAGLSVLLYHFTDHTDPVQECDKFLTTIGTTQTNEGLVLDEEVVSSAAPSFSQAFLARVRQLTNLNPGLYTYRDLLENHGFDFQPVRDSGFWLWLADYTGDPFTVPSCKFWGNPSVFQYTDSATILGISGKVDRNIMYPDFNLLVGSLTEMEIADIYGWRDNQGRNLVDFQNWMYAVVTDFYSRLDKVDTSIAGVTVNVDSTIVDAIVAKLGAKLSAS